MVPTGRRRARQHRLPGPSCVKTRAASLPLALRLLWIVAISAVRSAGILLYRRLPASGTQVLIGHMGGPFWARKDATAWSVPKGEVEGSDDDLSTALREFEEETGAPAPAVAYEKLGDFAYTSGKVVTVFVGESDFAVDVGPGNTVTIEWPRGSGAVITFPELDRLEWCSLEDAAERLVRGQQPAIRALAERI
jgi:predicted NUDIX family NTP pyrophosphohydrolase